MCAYVCGCLCAHIHAKAREKEKEKKTCHKRLSLKVFSIIPCHPLSIKPLPLAFFFSRKCFALPFALLILTQLCTYECIRKSFFSFYSFNESIFRKSINHHLCVTCCGNTYEINFFFIIFILFFIHNFSIFSQAQATSSTATVFLFRFIRLFSFPIE